MVESDKPCRVLLFQPTRTGGDVRHPTPFMPKSRTIIIVRAHLSTAMQLDQQHGLQQIHRNDKRLHAA